MNGGYNQVAWRVKPMPTKEHAVVKDPWRHSPVHCAYSCLLWRATQETAQLIWLLTHKQFGNFSAQTDNYYEVINNRHKSKTIKF